MGIATTEKIPRTYSTITKLMARNSRKALLAATGSLPWPRVLASLFRLRQQGPKNSAGP